jgi:uncharacterized protein YhdP
LPSDARDQLIAAARIEDLTLRRIAVDAAIDKVKLRFPEYFHQTPLNKE